MRIILFATALICIIYAAGANDAIESSEEGIRTETVETLPSEAINEIVSNLDLVVNDGVVASSSNGDAQTKTKTALSKIHLSSKKLKEILDLLAKLAKKEKKPEQTEVVLRDIFELLNNKELLEIIEPLLDK